MGLRRAGGVGSVLASARGCVVGVLVGIVLVVGAAPAWAATSHTAYVTNGSSTYNSLQAQLNRRFTNGASLTSAFTWQKSLDATQYLNVSDAAPWYGISANDRTFRFATSGIYQLPFGSGRRFANRNRGPVRPRRCGGQ